MSTDELDRFSDIPDPLRSGAVRVPPPPIAIGEEAAPTRGQAAVRRWLAVAASAGWIGAMLALVLGLRPDLGQPRVVVQLAVWSLGLPLGLAVALRPGKRGWPPGPMALRLGLGLLALVFVGLALLPVQGIEAPLTVRTVGMCLSFAFVLALPSLAGAILVLRSAFVNAPALRGAVVGAVCGLAGAVGIHAHCPVVSHSHVLLAHGLPIFVLAGVGAVFGVLRGRA